MADGPTATGHKINFPMDNERLTSPSRPWVSYGMTEGQLKEIQRRQIDGTMPMVAANNAKAEDFSSEAFRRKYAGYRIPAIDQIHYHIALRRRQFDAYSGEDVSDFTVQCYNVETFAQMENRQLYGGDINGFSGMELHLLHDPTKRTSEKE